MKNDKTFDVVGECSFDMGLKDNNSTFYFRSIAKVDIPLIHQWFNSPHVQEFYSLRQWTEAEVLEKLKPILSGEKTVFAFIINYSQKPIGYIQYYRVQDYPWPDQEIVKDICAQSAGLDLFIGDSSFIRKRLGSSIVKAFLDQAIWPHFSFCFVDPDSRNMASIRMFQNCGFKFHKQIPTEDALKRPVTLTLMKLSKDFDR